MSWRRAYHVLQSFGIDPRKALVGLAGVPAYVRDRIAFVRQLKRDEFKLTTNPCLGDRYATAGVSDWQYFYQDLAVAKRIFIANPHRHIDVGSRIDGFVAHVASFRELEVVDIRPMPRPIPGVTFRQANFMADIPDDFVGCCDSLSCLHALEHFGLGRYGDPVMHNGHLVGLKNLHSTLKKSGTLYLAVPIGPQRVEFNAHRVFAVPYLLQLFSGRFDVKRFSVIDDDHRFIENASYDVSCNYGCGIFELTKM